MKNFDYSKLINVGILLLSGLATIASSWNQEKTMEKKIKEEVAKALAEHNKC